MPLPGKRGFTMPTDLFPTDDALADETIDRAATLAVSGEAPDDADDDDDDEDDDLDDDDDGDDAD